MGKKSRGNVLVVSNAQIVFPNLSGRGSAYTNEGARSFLVEVPAKRAMKLAERGWKVIKLQRYGNDVPLVKVFFNEGTFPGVSVGDLENQTLVIYGYTWDVVHSRGRSTGVRPVLAGINEDKKES